MDMQTIGTAQPVLLVQTSSNNNDTLKSREQFSSDREFVRYLRKQLKDKAKKPEEKKDEKKTKTFTYWELVFIMLSLSFPVSMLQIGLGYAVVKVVRVLALGN